MSNNIIDTVTQAVNSLVSALKLPDESAKANDTLGSMNFPQFSRILPYKDYDSATGLFINNKTVGFMFEARPLPGADKSIVATLEHLLRSKLPRGVPVSFHLVSSKLVGNDIDYGLREFRWSGKQAKKFNAITDQLQSISPGQPFRLMQQRSAADVAIMKEIVRQVPELRPAVYSLIDRDIDRALATIEQVTPERVPRKEGAWVPGSSVVEFTPTQEEEIPPYRQCG